MTPGVKIYSRRQAQEKDILKLSKIKSGIRNRMVRAAGKALRFGLRKWIDYLSPAYMTVWLMLVSAISTCPTMRENSDICSSTDMFYH